MISALKQAISDEALIITATRRLAKQWQPILASQRVGLSPKMISQTDWLNGLWAHLEACGSTGSYYCLNATQEVILWKKIIESSTRGEQLLRIQATAKSVASAWALLKQWQISVDVLEDAGNEETQLFLKWAREFNQTLASQQLMTQACLPEKILEHIFDPILESYSPSKKIVLLGFEDISPQFQAFYTELRLKGWLVSEINSAPNQAILHYKYAFYDQSAELQAAALWAKSLREQVTHPGAIGIVVPDLAECRSLVEQIFTEVLEPLSELKGEQRVSSEFNISVAQALSAYPIIFAALKSFILLGSEKLNLEEVLFLIKSPFLDCLGFNLLERADYCDKLKKTEKQKFAFQELLLHSEGAEKSPLFKVGPFKQQLPPKTTLTNWAALFNQFLTLLSWPGERVLNSVEHQAMGRWQLLLEEFSALDKVLETQDLNSALRLLTGLLNELPFQGQSKPAPIHIMGILEASSQPFEYLWVTGLHNEAWPPIPKANPFLPIHLQRKHKMPHASSERELYFAQKLTDNLKNACGTVVFSYFKNDSVKAYHPSDLISDIVESHFALEKYGKIINVAEFLVGLTNKNKMILESVPDKQGPSIQEDSVCKGGSGVIQAQAACPFKAFVQYRLHTAPHYKPIVGLSPMQRGILVHTILEKVWFEIKMYEYLCQYSEEKLANVLAKIIENEIQSIQWAHPDLTASFWEVENWRLNQILKSWLILEKKRSPFRVVSQEHKVSITLSGLTFNLRLDRVDCDDNNQTIIIDYKTSAQAIADCFGDRPENPQLLLYCLSEFLDPKGVVFAQLQAEGCQFVGLTESEDIIPGVKSLENLNLRGEDIPREWSDLLVYWRGIVENLALEFRQGEARVSPNKGAQTCRTCHLLQVCRIGAREIENT